MPLLYDPLFLLVTLVVAIPGLIAQVRVKAAFARYQKVGTRAGLTGAEAARRVLAAGGVSGVAVERHPGFLSDHYDPRAKVLRLSPDVHDGRSVASVAVAAHEAGHAIQDATHYAPLVLRSAVVPATNIGARLWMLPFFIGVATNLTGLAWAGVVLFGLVVAFHLVTLPTEIDASNRAKAVLARTGIVSTQEEAIGVSRVLNAAAWTYAAAALSAILQLVYLVWRLQSSQRD